MRLSFPLAPETMPRLRAWQSRVTPVDVLASLCMAAFLVLRLGYFMQDVYVPDEHAHTVMMRQLITVNEQSFGAGYWVFGWLVTKLFGTAALPMLRLLSFLGIAGAIAVFHRVTRKTHPAYASWVSMALLTTPVAWFGGKLITGEFYQLGFMGLAAYVLFVREKAPWWVFVLLGFTVSFKISAAAPVACLLLLGFFHIQGHSLLRGRTYLEGLKVLAWVIVGFVICSPNVLYDFDGYRSYFLTNAMHRSGVGISFYFLNMQFISWDYIQSHGMFISFCSALSLAAYFAYALVLGAWRVLLICLLCAAVTLASIVVNAAFVPWHAFPSIVILWAMLALARPSAWSARYVPRFAPVLLLAIGIAANLTVLIRTVPPDLRAHRMFRDYMKNVTLQDDCFAHFLRAYPDRAPLTVSCHDSYLYNAREESFCDQDRLAQSFAPVRAARKHPFQIMPLFFPLIQGKTELLRDLLAHRGTLISIVNRRMEQIYAPYASAREDGFYARAIPDAESKYGLFIQEKSIGRCGNYEMIEYSAQPKANR